MTLFLLCDTLHEKKLWSRSSAYGHDHEWASQERLTVQSASLSRPTNESSPRMHGQPTARVLGSYPSFSLSHWIKTGKWRLKKKCHSLDQGVYSGCWNPAKSKANHKETSEGQAGPKEAAEWQWPVEWGEVRRAVLLNPPPAAAVSSRHTTPIPEAKWQPCSSPATGVLNYRAVQLWGAVTVQGGLGTLFV